MKTTLLQAQSVKNETIEDQLKQEILAALSNSGSPYVAEEINTENFDLEDGNQLMGIRLKNQAVSRNNPSQKRKPNIRNNTDSESLTVAMVYQSKPIGEIEIVLSDQGMDIDQIRTLFEQIAIDLAFFVKRQQAHQSIEQVRQLDLQWVGHSDSLKSVDRFIEKVSCVDFPVLIQGESGSGKLLTAYSIHCHSARKDQPFIESYCPNWGKAEIPEIMQNLLAKAKGGTLFLRDIDALAAEQVHNIRHYWRHVVSASWGSKKQPSPSVRLIASTSGADHEDGQEPWHELDYLSIQLPSLCDRRDDIKELILHYLQKLSYIKNIQLSPECWELFEKFNWQGNVKQLERIVSKLVVMADSSYLNPSALLAIVPQLKDERDQQINLEPASSGQTQSECNTECSTQCSIEKMSYNIAAGEYAGEVNQHPAIAKAIDHLAVHYSEQISLGELANIACVSPSHLSYLFKHHLGSTFKQLLIQVRIEKAKLRLREDKHRRITEIAFDVGFHDLSHFEKTFKRLVGDCPGKYRN